MRWILVVVAVTVVAGCSTSETSQPATGRTLAPVDNTAPPVVSVPDETHAVEVATLGLRFAVPDAYTELHTTDLGPDDYEADWFVDLAASIELDVDQLTTALRSNLELFAFAPVGADGFTDHLTVEVETSDGVETPEVDAITEQLEALAASDVEVEPIDANGTAAIRASYTDESSGRATYDLHVGHRGAIVLVSVIAADADSAAEVGELVAETLRVAS